MQSHSNKSHEIAIYLELNRFSVSSQFVNTIINRLVEREKYQVLSLIWWDLNRWIICGEIESLNYLYVGIEGFEQYREYLFYEQTMNYLLEAIPSPLWRLHLEWSTYITTKGLLQAKEKEMEGGGNRMEYWTLGGSLAL